MPYESRLELDRLWLADFDPSVTWIAAQPMWLRSRDGTAIRRHAPDLLLTRADRSLEVVDVKPGDPAQRPKAANVFDWTAPVCETRRWRYQVWSGVDPVRLANVRTLAIGRRPGHVDLDELARLRSVGKVGMTREHGSGARPPADADDGGYGHSVELPDDLRGVESVQVVVCQEFSVDGLTADGDGFGFGRRCGASSENEGRGKRCGGSDDQISAPRHGGVIHGV
ncbi:TnsA-like heteromeric transposase endonuclease subunit, partial [Brachybacterium sp. AOP3-A1-3]|uniref:TnsA-like heteromeric transposase endonuclease subunit n=1 Tax=Brachybacterium sp. AOP3-A1-3 TaxID=3457699 RepID=UPI00403436EC